MTALTIAVDIRPGTDPANSTFVYSKDGATWPYLRNNRGDILLPANKDSVTIRFRLKRTTLTIGGITYKLGLPTGALDIKDKNGQWPPVFTTPKLSGPPGQPHDTVEVIDNNQDDGDYKYALTVEFTPGGGGDPIAVPDDPRIKNGGEVRFPGPFWTPKVQLVTFAAFVLGFVVGWSLRGG